MEGVDPSPKGYPAAVSWRAIALVLPALMAAGCGADRVDERAVAGKEVYLRECARCHMIDGTGYAGVYPNLRHNPIVELFSPEPMIEIVDEGREAMPAFGTELPAQKLADVITY